MTSKNEQTLQNLLIEIDSLLASEEFVRVGYSFVKAGTELQQFIEIQRSASESAGEIRFTLNVGILSRRLHQVLWSRNAQETSVWHCHVLKRVGFLLPQRSDRWWSISRSTQSAILQAEVSGILIVTVLPFIRPFRSDDDLRRYLRQLTKDREATYTDVVNLCLLDAALGGKAEFDRSLRELQRLGMETGLSDQEVQTKVDELVGCRTAWARR